MKPKRWWTRAAATVLVLAALVLLWPAQLGGRLSMLVTVGRSMEPRISQGDLVLVSRGAPYRVGEIVAYHSGELRQVALHRIVARAGGRYTLKGDDNSWLDTSRPTDAEILGRLWLHLPGAGKWLDWLRRPRETALLTALLGLGVSTGIHQARKRMRRRRRTGQPARGGGGLRVPDWRRLTAAGPVRGIWARVALAAAGVLALGAAIGLAGLAQPVQRERTELVDYEHRGAFGYEAGGAGPLVDPREPGEGGPVYFKLANRMSVAFDYALETSEAADVSGTYRLAAVVGDARGWRRTMVLRPTAAFTGDSFAAEGTLSLPGLQALIQRFEDATGLEGGTYELRLRAETSVRGTIDGLALRDEFAPELLFDVDDFAIRPRAREEGDPFHPVESGAVPRSSPAPNRLRLLGLAAGVGTVRVLGLALSVLGAAVLCGALLARRGAPVESPSQRIALRYGSRIVDVERVEPRPDERIVRMTDIRDLVRIAENLDAPILHAREGGLHRYLVQEGATTYTFELADTASSDRPAVLSPPSWPAPSSGLPAPLSGLPAPSPGLPASGRLPAPAVEIDLSAPLPPVAAPPPRPAGGVSLPPAPPRRPR
jgi:signal peptidase I